MLKSQRKTIHEDPEPSEGTDSVKEGSHSSASSVSVCSINTSLDQESAFIWITVMMQGPQQRKRYREKATPGKTEPNREHSSDGVANHEGGVCQVT